MKSSRFVEKSTERLKKPDRMYECVCRFVHCCGDIVILYLFHSNLLFVRQTLVAILWNTRLRASAQPLSISMEYVSDQITYTSTSTNARTLIRTVPCIYNQSIMHAISFNSILLHFECHNFSICSFSSRQCTLSHAHIRFCEAILWLLWHIKHRKTHAKYHFLILGFDFSPFIMHMHFFSVSRRRRKSFLLLHSW